MSSSGVGSTSSLSNRNSRKNSSGNRSDVGWEHGLDVNGDSKTVKCKYCNGVFSEGIFRFKHHLACTRQNVKNCTSVPDDVRKLMLSTLIKNSEDSRKKKREFYFGDDDDDDSIEEIAPPSKRKGKNTMDGFLKKSTQSTINQLMKKDLREDVCQQIARFFYTSAISFNCVKNPEFAKMIELIGRYGIGLKPPPYYEIREKYLKKEVIRINDMLEEYRMEWKKTGCSNMSDGWINNKRRSICNFLVNSPKETFFYTLLIHLKFQRLLIKCLKC